MRTSLMFKFLAVVAMVGCGAAPSAPEDGNNGEQDVTRGSSLAGYYTAFRQPVSATGIEELDLRTDGTFQLLVYGSVNCADVHEPVEMGYECPSKSDDYLHPDYDTPAGWTVVHGTWAKSEGGVTLTPKPLPGVFHEPKLKTGTPLKLSLEVKGKKAPASVTISSPDGDKTFTATLDVDAVYTKPASAKVADLAGVWTVDFRDGNNDLTLFEATISNLASHEVYISQGGNWGETVKTKFARDVWDRGTFAIAGDPNGTAGVLLLQRNIGYLSQQIVYASHERVIVRREVKPKDGPAHLIDITLTRTR